MIVDEDTGGGEVFDLRLYVAGQSPKSVRAIENLRRGCDQHLAGQCRIEIIDLIVHPKLARGDEIIAVPTLVRRLPEPDPHHHRGPVRHRPGPRRPAAPRGRPAITMTTPTDTGGGADGNGDGAADGGPGWSLTLYVSGASPRSAEAIDTARRICDQDLAGRVDLTVIDVSEQPALAVSDDIFAVPTPVKRLPAPLRQLVGNLADLDRVRAGLDHGPVRTPTPTEGSVGR